MWKIKIIYKDKSSCTLTGNHKEIPLELAVNYFNKEEHGLSEDDDWHHRGLGRAVEIVKRGGVDGKIDCCKCV